MNKILSLAVLGLLISCQPKEPKITGGGIFIYSSSCQINNNSSLPIICVAYAPGFPGGSLADCYDKSTHYNNQGYDAASEMHTQGATLQECPAGGKIGTCILPNSHVLYFNNAFTSGQGLTDCSILGGTFQ